MTVPQVPVPVPDEPRRRRLRWPRSRQAESKKGYYINPSWLERGETLHGGDVKVMAQLINGRPVVTYVKHVGPDQHQFVPAGGLCRCGWRAPE